jgi:hypothetical protein
MALQMWETILHTATNYAFLETGRACYTDAYPLRKCLADVAGSDLYVGLVGWRAIAVLCGLWKFPAFHVGTTLVVPTPGVAPASGGRPPHPRSGDHKGRPYILLRPIT